MSVNSFSDVGIQSDVELFAFFGDFGKGHHFGPFGFRHDLGIEGFGVIACQGEEGYCIPMNPSIVQWRGRAIRECALLDLLRERFIAEP